MESGKVYNLTIYRSRLMLFRNFSPCFSEIHKPILLSSGLLPLPQRGKRKNIKIDTFTSYPLETRKQENVNFFPMHAQPANAM